MWLYAFRLLLTTAQKSCQKASDLVISVISLASVTNPTITKSAVVSVFTDEKAVE
jgi:hypothetical protein